MDTLRGFVDAVLDQQQTNRLVDAKYYSKPDFLSDNYELRRLVSAGGHGDRTDFYEFYWAHLMPTAAWDRLAGWYWVLMYRRFRDVPGRIKPIWLLSWLVLIGVVALGVYSSTHFLLGYPVAPGALDKAPWFLLLVIGILSATVRSFIGDAAVYLSPTPANIEARQKIRAAGLNLLDKVIASGRYDRVIVVGHSLGSIIGYDILSLAWQKRFDDVRARLTAAWQRGELPKIASVAIRNAEGLAKTIRDIDDPNEAEREELAGKWRRATWEVAEEQASNGDPWPISDFVTLGSPLTYANFLLARDDADFGRRTGERELPHCPPARELTRRFSFEHKGVDNQGRVQKAVVLNSAAVFAATAWTNLFYPSFAVLRGDFIGGPVAPLFWAGVRDVPVETSTWAGWLAHTHYWTRNPLDNSLATAPLPNLREALDLGRERKWPLNSQPAATTTAAANVATSIPDAETGARVVPAAIAPRRGHKAVNQKSPRLPLSKDPPTDPTL